MKTSFSLSPSIQKADHAPARDAARLAGQKRYRGHVCPKCGGVERYTSDASCCVCIARRKKMSRAGERAPQKPRLGLKARR